MIVIFLQSWNDLQHNQDDISIAITLQLHDTISCEHTGFRIHLCEIEAQAQRLGDYQIISHYNDVLMSTMASQITILISVYSTVYVMTQHYISTIFRW